MTTSQSTTQIPCRWLNDPNSNASKHISHNTHKSEAKFYRNILEAVGHTPMVRLNKIPQSFGLKCEILVKCEYLNPGGSIKDRVSLRMIEDAEKVNALHPGSTIIEATSGNTGIGLSLVAAVKGYKMIITLPEKMSQEKVNTMKGLGAQVLRTPTEAASTHPDSHFSLAKRLLQEIPNSTILDQFSNSSNPLAHYDGTANEIIQQCGEKLDYFFAGAGTGGTLTGCASRLKEVYPNIKIVGVDPTGSMIADPNAKNPVKKPYQIEGIGGDFVPNTCVHGFINEWVKTDDKESFDIARMLIKEEGLLVGGSSGAAVSAAIQYALKNDLGENDRIVVILPDSVRNYVNKFLDDDWMVEKGFLSNEIYLNKKSKLFGKKARDLKLKQVEYFTKDLTVDQAFQEFEKGADVIPIVENGKIKGVLSANKWLCPVENKGLGAKDTIEKCIIKDFISVDIDTDLSIVQKLLEKHQVVFVEERDDEEEDEDTSEDALKLYAITGRDLLRAFNNNSNNKDNNKEMVKKIHTRSNSLVVWSCQRQFTVYYSYLNKTQ